jgi:hypothetical protein
MRKKRKPLDPHQAGTLEKVSSCIATLSMGTLATHTTLLICKTALSSPGQFYMSMGSAQHQGLANSE